MASSGNTMIKEDVVVTDRALEVKVSAVLHRTSIFHHSLHEKINSEHVIGNHGLLFSPSKIAAIKELASKADIEENNIVKIKRSRGRTSVCSSLTEIEKKLQLDYSVLVIQRPLKLIALYEGKARLLGDGSDGKVKLGQDLETGEWLAIKIQEVGRYDIDRVKQEAEINKEIGLLRADALRKTHRFYDKYYIIQELLKGKTLEQTRLVNFEERLEVAIAILNEIIKIHAKKIIHNDIRTHNIIYDPISKRVTIIDYGLSKKIKEHDEKDYTADISSIKGVLIGCFQSCHPYVKKVRELLNSTDSLEKLLQNIVEIRELNLEFNRFLTSPSFF